METHPLSQSQLEIYWEQIQHPESIEYNLPASFRLSKSVDVERLKRAIRSVIEFYPIFRTRVITQNGELRQYSDDNLQIDIPVIYISEEEVEQQISEFIRPFDPQKEALIRSLLIETPVALYFILDVYHLIWDGVSYALMMHFIDMAYSNQPLVREQMSLYEYAEQEILSIGTPSYQRAATYYKEKFKDVEIARLAQKNNHEGYIIQKKVFITRELIDDFCAQQGVTPNLLFMSAFEIVLSRFSGEKNIAYATMNHGRIDKKLRESLGAFIKIAPVLIRINETQELIDFIKSHKQEFTSTIHFGIFPFLHFCQQQGIISEQINFGFQGAVTEEVILCGENIEGEQRLLSGLSAEEPSVLVYWMHDAYEIRLQYVECQYEDDYMQRFIDAMVICIKQILISPNSLLKDISIIS
ncbi:MAG: condensation domain-containing protein [Odoribacter sp.]